MKRTLLFVLALLLVFPGCQLISDLISIPLSIVDQVLSELFFWAEAPAEEGAGDHAVPLDVALREAVRAGARGELVLRPPGVPPAAEEPLFPGARRHAVTVSGARLSEPTRLLLREHGLTLIRR